MAQMQAGFALAETVNKNHRWVVQSKYWRVTNRAHVFGQQIAVIDDQILTVPQHAHVSCWHTNRKRQPGRRGPHETQQIVAENCLFATFCDPTSSSSDVECVLASHQSDFGCRDQIDPPHNCGRLFVIGFLPWRSASGINALERPHFR